MLRIWYNWEPGRKNSMRRRQCLLNLLLLDVLEMIARKINNGNKKVALRELMIVKWINLEKLRIGLNNLCYWIALKMICSNLLKMTKKKKVIKSRNI